MHILIVETDPQLLQEMQQGLEQAGHIAIPAANGLVAWDHLVGRPAPDLLVTRVDLGSGMPPGTALGRFAQAAQPRIPVVYIPADAERAEDADATHGAILIKPFDSSELVTVVNRLLSYRDGSSSDLELNSMPPPRS